MVHYKLATHHSEFGLQSRVEVLADYTISSDASVEIELLMRQVSSSRFLMRDHGTEQRWHALKSAISHYRPSFSAIRTCLFFISFGKKCLQFTLAATQNREIVSSTSNSTLRKHHTTIHGMKTNAFQRVRTTFYGIERFCFIE